ncbi:LysR family transcriptional regulator [Rhizobacter sp. LjRoot28]|uniref:LysR family transcriptional regulator n=1 Tax=Rhizobacter sp. LjRoot28 TaxID=3342309 RepID=UPI003ECECB96
MELLQSMEVFVKLAEVGSYTKAADAMQMSRPQATLVIQELERQIGARLLHRTTRKVTLTSEGEAFYDRAKDILGSVATATAMFGSAGGPVRGRLRIDLPSVFGQLPFFESLNDFAALYPEIELGLGVTDRLVDLVAEGIDCAIRIGDLTNSTLVARRIGAVKMVTCAAPAYLERMGTPESLADLNAHRGVKFMSGESRRPLPWLFKDAGQETSVNAIGRVSINESHAYVQCGVAGFGIVQLPGFMVDRELASGALVEVLQEFRPSARPVSLLYPSRTHVAPQVNVFAAWIRTSFPKLRPEWIEN